MPEFDVVGELLDHRPVVSTLSSNIRCQSPDVFAFSNQRPPDTGKILTSKGVSASVTLYRPASRASLTASRQRRGDTPHRAPRQPPPPHPLQTTPPPPPPSPP